MKHLNKNFPTSPLNQKIRKWYRLKQEVNNAINDEYLKQDLMRYCDRQIALCWRRSYQGLPGYEVKI